jgi:pimeloyl-ACP methyl ester carboxylesterase
MLGYYRAVEEDMRQNEKLFANKIKTPVLALGGDVGSAPNIHELMRPLCKNLRGGLIEACGHYIPEEQPAKLATELVNFL